MPSRLTLSGALLIATAFATVSLQAQAVGDSLRQHYNRAEDLQRAGNPSAAADEYRAFLAGALGELAMGYGLAPDYQRSAPLFDEALSLEPNSPTLLLDYARTAVTLGDLSHAKTLAIQFIRTFPDNRAQLAQAHQVLGRALLKMNRDQEARKELETAVDLDPTFQNGYDLAVACLDLDDDKCAVQLFDEMEKSFGDTPEIHMAFGRAYGDSDFQPRAVTEFTRAIQENPRLPGAHYLLAAVQLATGDDESHVAAVEDNLKRELLISPRDAMSYTAMGKITATRNNYPAAEAYFKKAISLDPNNPDTWLYLGQMDFDMNRMIDAEKALRQCVTLTQDVSRNRYQVQKAHFLLGRILMQKGQQNAAHAEMQLARDLANKTLSQDKSKLAGLMDSAGAQDTPESTPESETTPSPASDPTRSAALRRVDSLRVQMTPAVADSYNNLGAIAAAGADYAKAVGYFERASEWNPSLEGLDYNWGRAAFAGSLFRDAIPPLTRYARAHRNDQGALSVLGISQFMVGKYQDCLRTLNPVIGAKDLAPQVEFVFAQSLVMTGQVSDGTQRLIALEKAHPEIPDVHRSLGEAFSRQGNTREATEQLNTAIRQSPRDGEAHYDLGAIELTAGGTTAAVAELETAVRISPGSEKFHRELALAYKAALRPVDAQRETDASNALQARSQSNTTPHMAAAPEQ